MFYRRNNMRDNESRPDKNKTLQYRSMGKNDMVPTGDELKLKLMPKDYKYIKKNLKSYYEK